MAPDHRWTHIISGYSQQLLDIASKYENMYLDLASEALGELPLPTMGGKREWARKLVEMLLPPPHVDEDHADTHDHLPAFWVYVSSLVASTPNFYDLIH